MFQSVESKKFTLPHQIRSSGVWHIWIFIYDGNYHEDQKTSFDSFDYGALIRIHMVQMVERFIIYVIILGYINVN